MASIRIYRPGSLSTGKAPEKNFTGDVFISDYFESEAPARHIVASVSFAPGARTPWKVNPLGQTLIITGGAGRAQCEGEAVVEIRAGDIVWCPPGKWHWDGAAPNHLLTYIAVHEAIDGAAVSFGNKVTDEEYNSSN